MKTIAKQNLRVEDPNDRYGDSSFNLTLSNEILSLKDIGSITNIVQQAAIAHKYEFKIDTQFTEKPETDEEIATVKAAKEANEQERKQREDARREELVAKVILKASESDDPYSIAIQNAIDDLSSWDQSPVRKLLKERDLLTLA